VSSLYINGISLLAPGLDGWSASVATLRGELPWQAVEMPTPVPQLLPANERRRTTALIKLALQTAQHAMDMAQVDASQLANVFACSDGDFFIVDRICEALTQQSKPISPTLFHNSVHNAPAGYWAIAVGSQQPSSSIAAGDGTFAAGLLETVTSVQQQNKQLLLIAYEYPATSPSPLKEKRDAVWPFALAMVLGQDKQAQSLARLQIELVKCDETESCHDNCRDVQLEKLRIVNPAAKSLPLLQAICRSQTSKLRLPYLLGLDLGVCVEPC